MPPEIKETFISLINESFLSDEMTVLQDVVGVSLKRKPQQKHLRKLPNKYQYSSIIYIIIDNTEPQRAEEELNKFPLFININFLREHDNHYYNPERRNWLLNPIDVNSRGDYLLDINSKELIDNAGKRIDILKSVDMLYAKHVDPSILIRVKLFWFKVILLKTVEFVSNLFDWLYWSLFGLGHKYPSVTKRLVEYHTQDRAATQRAPQAIVYAPKPVSFLGYEISKWTIASYSFVGLATYTLFYLGWLHSHYFSAIFSNTFLTTLFGLFTLTIYDLILPQILKSIIKLTTDYYWNLSYKEISL